MQWDGVHLLVEQARRGDREAADRLYALARPYLVRRAADLLGPNWPEKSVSDLIQETWLRAWKAIAQFQGGNDDANTAALFRAWLARTMRHIWLNELRRPDPSQSLNSQSVEGVGPTPSEAVREDERRVVVRRAVDDLPDTTDREVVRMVFFEGLSFSETGRRLGLHESTVRYRIQKVLGALGSRVEGLR